MKIRIERATKNPKNKISKQFHYLAEKLGNHKKQSFTHYSTNCNNQHIAALNNIQVYSNPALYIEAEIQRSKALLCANATRFR